MSMQQTMLTRAAILALFLSMSTSVLAASHSKDPVPLRECSKHDRPTSDCHVHDMDTYRHLQLLERDKLGIHARREMHEFEREDRQKMKN